jgi:hypothetical protein
MSASNNIVDHWNPKKFSSSCTMKIRINERKKYTLKHTNKHIETKRQKKTKEGMKNTEKKNVFHHNLNDKHKQKRKIFKKRSIS